MPAELPQLTAATTAVVGAAGTAAGGVGAWLLRWRSARRDDVSALTQALETLAQRNSALIEEADRRWHRQHEREEARWRQEQEDRRRLHDTINALEGRVADLEHRLASAHRDITRLLVHLQEHGLERPPGLSPEAPGNGRQETKR